MSSRISRPSVGGASGGVNPAAAAAAAAGPRPFAIALPEPSEFHHLIKFSQVRSLLWVASFQPPSSAKASEGPRAQAKPSQKEEGRAQAKNDCREGRGGGVEGGVELEGGSPDFFL